MIIISIDQEIRDFAAHWAPIDTINGFSNLSSDDLAKATRVEYNYTGLFGEAGWYRWRYGTDGLKKLHSFKEIKAEVWRTERKGDGGEDDRITFRGTPRFLDVKTTHIKSASDAARMNLVVAPGELHPNMVYVAAFAVGPNRQNATEVVLAGWCLNEDLKERFFADPVKFAVKVRKLTPIENLSKHF